MAPTILDFIRKVLREDISPAQEALLSAIYGLPVPHVSTTEWLRCQSLDALYGLPIRLEDEGAFQHFTSRDKPPKRRQQEATIICGRRSGKTGRIAINVGLWEALRGGHERSLGRAERGHVILMAQDLRMVNEAMLLAKAKVQGNPTLARLVVEERAHELVFANRMVLAIRPCSYRAPRGLGIAACLMDEVGVWDVEGVNPDKEVVRAVKPAMATFPNRLLLKFSTPWAKAGILWEDWDAFYGEPDAPVLVWSSPTWYMNPSIPAEFFVGEWERDPEYAAREFGAVFSDLQDAFLPVETITAAVDAGITERAPDPDRAYMAAIDVAFVTDASVLCIAHREGPAVVVDVWRGWRPKHGRPLQLEPLACEVAGLCKAYGVGTILGDQYAAEPVREAFTRHGISFSEVAFTARRWKRHTTDERREVGASKLDIFGAMKTLLRQGRMRLLDCPQGIRELRNLQAWRSRTGHEQIGAPAGQHDDYPSALALVAWQTWRAAEHPDQPVDAVRTGPFLFQQFVAEEDIWNEDCPEALQSNVQVSLPTVGLGGAWLIGGLDNHGTQRRR